MVGVLTWSPAMGMWTIDGAPMCGPAFKPRNLELLWSTRPLNIANQPLGGVPGELEQMPTMPGATHAITMEIGAACSQAGVPHASWAEGLDLNYIELCDTVGDPLTWGAASIATEVVRPSGLVVGGPIQAQVSPISSGAGGEVTAIVSVTIPFGKLTVVP